MGDWYKNGNGLATVKVLSQSTASLVFGWEFNGESKVALIAPGKTISVEVNGGEHYEVDGRDLLSASDVNEGNVRGTDCHFDGVWVETRYSP